MTTRNESLRDQIATIVQAGYSQRKTSVETADEIRSKISLLSIVTALELKLAEADKDTARLDWLLQETGPQGFRARVLMVEDVWYAGGHVRPAIDAAMAEPK